MRVEPCGELFAEPKVGDKFFQPQRSSEPITIINPKSNYLEGKGRTFSELNLEGDAVIVGQNLNFAFENEGNPLPIGFFLTEEEWSLFKQPHLGLEPYERKKMASLPKSFTPFTMKTDDGSGLDRRANADTHGSASDLTWLRKCDTALGGTPSPCYTNEPNNNIVCRPTSERKIVSQTPRDYCENQQNEPNEKENWQEVGDCDSEEAQQFDNRSTDLVNNNHDLDLSSDPEGCSDIYYSSESLNIISNEGIGETEKISDIDCSVMVGYSQQPPSYVNSSVGRTIGSHPEPITSCSQNQIHSPSNCHYPHCKSGAHLQTNLNNSSYSFPSYITQEQYQQPNTFEQSSIWMNNNNGIGYQNIQNWNQADTAVPQDFFPTQMYAESNNYSQPIAVRTDEMETLVTFLSKFDDKVAAIWGQDGTAAAALAANIQYTSEGYHSTSSTPIGSSYPWGSPTAEVPSAQCLFDFHAMHRQVEQQQRTLADSQRAAESFYEKQYQRDCKDVRTIIQSPKASKPYPSNRITIGPSRGTPPEGKYTIMHAIKQHFGTAASEEDYYILKASNTESSDEEKEKSLERLSHAGETSGFVRFLPRMQLNKNPIKKPEQSSNSEILPKARPEQPFEIDMKQMQDVLVTLDLESEELEIVAASDAAASIPIPNVQAPKEKFGPTWKTHFATVENLEASNYHYYLASPATEISPSQINPNLPEFNVQPLQQDTEYGLFKNYEKTLFPIRFKLRPENEQAVQTENFGGLTENTLPGNSNYMYYPNRSTFEQTFDSSQTYVPDSPYSFSPGTPMDRNFTYGYDNGLEIQTSGWFTDANGLGSGSMIENEYNGGGVGSGSIYGGGVPAAIGVGRNHTYLQSEDSGIGNDGSSRTGFYDDPGPTPTDCEGEYEYAMAGRDDQGILLPPAYGYQGVPNSSDVDYGHFQGFSFHPGSSSSVSGKHGKGNRRRAKVKPCKYFMLDGSCRRGKDCKFSHDLTTCRYWAEGSCLKGESCPYMHCFLERRDFNFDYTGRYRRAGSKRYHLESENDFPALGSTKSNAMLSSPMPTGAIPLPVLQGSGGSFSSESLIMLADAGSGGFGFCYDRFDGRMLPEAARGSENHVDEFVGGLPFDMMMRHNDIDSASVISEIGESLGSSPSTSTTRTRRGTNKGNGHNQNSNNWISNSMITVKEKSVKEKRKKKKH